MRSQANTAKLLADNPTLMRLRELEVLEKVAAYSKLNILLGDVSPEKRGLADRVEALDGTLAVVSEPGVGTRIRAEIPCG